MLDARPSWTLTALILAALTTIFYASGAVAIGNDLVVGGYACLDNGQSTGQLLQPGASCPTTLGVNNFFSFLICNMEQLSSNLLGHMFCGMATQLEPAVWAAVTLAITFFGISFMIGLTPATGAEAVMFLLKIGFVVAFATEADVIIDYGYRLLIGGIADGVTVVVKLMGAQNINDGTQLFAALDAFIAKVFQFATDSAAGVNKDTFCKNALFALVATMMVIFPMMGYIAILIIARIALTVFRAVFGYVYAVTGIAFLMLMAPFFLCFFLFKQTADFFHKWLGYLVSLTLQAILLFAFLAFIVTMDLGKNNLLSNLTNIVMYNDEEPSGTAIRWPWKYCTLCDFDIVDKDTNNVLPVDAPGNVTNGRLQCKRNPPQKEDAIRPTFATTPDSTGQLSRLLELAGLGLLPVLILAMIVERMLVIVPTLAQRLSAGMLKGGGYSPQIGGGAAGTVGAMRMPGESLLDNFGHGFKRGYSDASGSSVGRATQGFKDGFSGMLVGRRGGQALHPENAELQSGAGIKNTFSRYLADPNRFGQ